MDHTHRVTNHTYISFSHSHIHLLLTIIEVEVGGKKWSALIQDECPVTATPRRSSDSFFNFFLILFIIIILLLLFIFNSVLLLHCLSLSCKSIYFFFCFCFFLPFSHKVAPGSKATWIILRYVCITNMSTLNPQTHSSICSLTAHSLGVFLYLFILFFFTFVYPFRWIDNGRTQWKKGNFHL